MIKYCPSCQGQKFMYRNVYPEIDYFNYGSNEKLLTQRPKEERISCPDCGGLGKFRTGAWTPISEIDNETLELIKSLGPQAQIEHENGILTFTSPYLIYLSDDKLLNLISTCSKVGTIMEQKYNWMVNY